MAKQLQGVVTSTVADKTIVVSVVSSKTHPLYKKKYSVTNKIMAHDEKNECLLGDTVIIAETRPISRRKYFSLVKILSRAAISAQDRVEAVAKVDEVEAPRPKSEKVDKEELKVQK